MELLGNVIVFLAGLFAFYYADSIGAGLAGIFLLYFCGIKKNKKNQNH